ncbi:hypothetical protein MMC13_007863 [Lambiella insularis]|nr:hypothetical protein [Lambiella insularis]
MKNPEKSEESAEKKEEVPNAYLPQSPIAESTTSAVHRPRPRHVPGYPGFAHVVGQNPGYSIFRRFTTLDTKILLYLQAELMQLEHELSDMEVANSESDDNPGLQQSVASLMHAEEGSEGWKQWQLIHELIKKKKQYNELMLDHERLYKLPEPSSDDCDFLHEFADAFLKPPDNGVWRVDEKGKREYDLVTLSTRADQDPFSLWFFNKLHPLYHRLFVEGRIEPNEMGMYEYNDQTLKKILANVSVVISSLLPLASIFALYFITNAIYQLVFILLFSGFFSACLALFTDAGRIEIFVSTMAIISIQVVFVGTNGTTPASGG